MHARDTPAATDVVEGVLRPVFVAGETDQPALEAERDELELTITTVASGSI